ncbi:hypothetical protein [Arcobacter lacus]|uniref:Uncharacterized protein n=1 Tax=Arcobacter lacus TaxID=1912876 RepID=A0ABX5JK60_9BACT|nr:hypothetical protein [Arcobacter lacus]PUE67168.1 hypothetical protein B0175_03060 [Arcobacter lacus]
MATTITDKSLLKNITDYDIEDWTEKSCNILKKRSTKEEGLIDFKKKLIVNNPLDEESVKELKEIEKLIKENDPDVLYKNIDKVLDIWTLLIRKSLVLLRICDLREPYLEFENKNPSPYGLSELRDFMKSYQEYEKLLYATPNYRDHIVHVFKTWLIGMNIFIDQKEYFDNLCLDGVKHSDEKFVLTPLEKISIWTLISLCHDLGYPLEKAQKILDKTTGMLKYFVANPQILSDIKFTDTQDKMNQIIIEMASSKIVPEKVKKDDDKKDELYTAIIQPKYYMKFLKSFEKNSHGLISSIILYKILLYFMESEFSTNVNYKFTYMDAIQYLIRREILRAISSHTTKDIYYLNANTFSFLLTFCDDLQEWGRRDWNSMYTHTLNDKKITIEKFEKNNDVYNIEIEEIFEKQFQEKEFAKIIQQIYEYQFISYRTIFRDGLDTQNRTFNFKKRFKLSTEKGKTISVQFTIVKDEQALFTVGLDDLSESIKKEIFDNLNTEKFFLEKTPKDSKKIREVKEITIK